jgi:hypothetical protein
MAYKDGGHCGHEIGQKLWKWGKLEGRCRAYWNAMIIKVTPEAHWQSQESV